MKKIISTLALATLAFGSSFADVKFAMNYRTQAVGFSRVFSAGGVGSDRKAYGGTLGTTGTAIAAENDRANSYLFHQTAYGTPTDSFKISGSNDFGGVTFEVNPNASSEKISAFKQYNAYVKLGAFTITAGRWADGIMAGGYQLKTDVDAAGLAGADGGLNKLGSLHTKAITTRATDIAYTPATNGTVNTGYITYKGDVGDATLTVDLVANSLGGKDTWDDSDIFSGIALRADAKLESWDFEFVFKQALAQKAKSIRSLSLYAQPLSWGNLQASFGGALGYYNGELTEWTGDLRLRYADGPLSITSMNNISYMTDSALKSYYKDTTNQQDYAGHVGAAYMDSTGTVNRNGNVNKWSQSAMWNAILVRYKINDTITALFNVGDIIGFNAGGKYLKDYGMEAFVAPGVQIYAGKNASIVTVAHIGFDNLLLETDEDKNNGKYVNGNGDNLKPTMALLVPVIFRIKL